MLAVIPRDGREQVGEDGVEEGDARVTGWHEKSVLRVLGGKPHLQPEGPGIVPVRTGRPRKLSKATGRMLHVMCKMVGQRSGERLWTMLPDLLAWAVGEVPGCTEAIGKELLSVSASGMRRRCWRR